MKVSHNFKKLLLFVILLVTSLRISAQIFGSPTVCANTSVLYTTIIFPTGYAYSWNVTGAAQNIPNSGNVAVTWGSPGTGVVNLVVKDPSGLTVYSGSLAITIKPVPSPKIIPLTTNGCSFPLPPRLIDGVIVPRDSSDVCLIVCDSSIFKYSAALPNATHSYSWTIIPAFVAMGTTVTALGQIQIKWASPTTFPITLRLYEKDNSTGCSDSIDACIRIIPRPNAAFGSIPAAINNTVNICLNSTVFFNDLSTVDVNSSIASWYWTFGDGTSSILQNPTHTYTIAGTFVTKLIVQNQCHCRDSMIRVINVQTQPGPDIFCVSPVCYSSTGTYCTGYTCTPLTWSVTSGTITSTHGSNGSCIDVNWGGNGPGSITLQGGSCSGSCPYPTTVLVPILPSTVAISGTTNTPCPNSINNYSVPNVPGTTYSWTVIGSATLMAGQGTNAISVLSGTESTSPLPSGQSTYTLKVNFSNSFLKCSGSAVASYTIWIASYIQPENDVICQGGSTTLNIHTGGGLVYGGPRFFYTIDPMGALTPSYTTFPVTISNFTTVGTYYVTTYIGSPTLGCPNMAYPIQVIPSPPPPVASISTVICPGQTILYTATPASNNYFLHWGVSGGIVSQSSGNGVSVTWNQTGPWTLTLTQQDAMPPGCASSPLIFNMNTATVPSPTIIAATSACENSKVSYSTSAVADYYNWAVVPSNIGSIIPGTSPNTMMLQLNNGSAGTATVFLQVIRCGSSSTQSKVLTISPLPSPTITLPAPICQNTSAFFLSASLGTSYSWSFSDGFQTTGQTGVHAFAAPGMYSVTAVVVNPGTCIGATSFATRTVNVIAAPIASITSPNNLSGCTTAPLSYSLYAIAQTQAGTPGYTWSPVPSSTYSVITTLSGPHSLTVSLNGCLATTTVVITTTNCSTGGGSGGGGTTTPCSFATAGTHSCSFTYVRNCNVVNFTPIIAGSGGAVVSWTLGDPANTTSTLSSPSMTYNTAGFYSVKLQCSWPAQGGGFCFKDTTLPVTIPMKAKFTQYFSCGSGTTLVTNFVDQSNYIPTISIASRSWLINPGALTSTATNPTFSLAAGTYTAQLTITASGSSVTCTSTQTLLVPIRPIASFTVPTIVCEASPITFTGTPSPTVAVLNYLWSFGDGTNLFKATPTLTAIKAYGFLSSLPYQANLTITDIYNCTSNFGPIGISVNQNKFTSTNVAVTPTTGLICQGDSVQLCGSSVGTVNPNTPFTYLWTNLSNSVCVYAKQNGVYGVILIDKFGCQSQQKFAFMNTVIVPVPTIWGEQSYCVGQKPLLSIDKGAGYTYQWGYNYLGANLTTTCTSGLFPPPVYSFSGGPPFIPLCTAMTPSIPTTYTGTINLQGFITETSSGLNCTAKSPTVNIAFHPLPLKPTVVMDQCVKATPITLSASGSGSLGLIWNTGAQGSTINVNNPGKYWASSVDNFGCKSTGDTAYVWPLPDLNFLIFGCFSICDTGTTVIPVPPGYAQYSWLKTGYGTVGGPSATPINLSFTNPSTLPGGNAGLYRLALKTNNGCVDTSKLIVIDIKPCRTCTMSSTASFSCHVTNSVSSYYNFSLNINNGAASPVNYTIGCSNGGLTNLSPIGGVFTAGANTLTGKFTPTANVSQCCITFTVKLSDGSICFWNKCFPVPPCNPSNCAFTPTLNLTCSNIVNGKPVYNYNLSYNYSATSSGTASISSAEGNITPTMSIANPGLNVISGSFTDTPAFDGTFCLDAYISNTLTGWCYQQVCKPLPLVSPCFTTASTCSVINTSAVVLSTPTINALGQPVYTMSLTLSTANGPFSFYVMSSQGIAGPNSSTIISTTPIVHTNTFVQTQPLFAGGNLCFTVVATNQRTGESCLLPYCVVISSGPPGNRLINNVVMNLYPNPTGDYTIAEYSLDNIEPLPEETSGYNQISIIDLNGREVLQMPLADTRGKVQVNTSSLIPGIYFLRAMNSSQVLMVKKLIIQR